MTRNTKYEINIVLYIKKVMKRNGFFDIPCYIDVESMKRVDQVTTQSKGVDESYKHIIRDFVFPKKDVIGCVQLLAPMVETPKIVTGWTSMYLYYEIDHRKLKLIKADNPNEPDSNNNSPIAMAIRSGDTEIVKILAPLSSNLNIPVQTRMGHNRTCRIL